MTLTEFLLARIAEDEAAAREVQHYMPDGGEIHIWLTRREGDEERSKKVAPYDPARVLAECEAKRKIVELRYSWNLQAEREPVPPIGAILKAQVVTADTVLRTLAAIHRDHPDFDPAWA